MSVRKDIEELQEEVEKLEEMSDEIAWAVNHHADTLRALFDYLEVEEVSVRAHTKIRKKDD